VFSVVTPSERKRSPVEPTSPKARLRRAGGPVPPDRAKRALRLLVIPTERSEWRDLWI